MTDKIEDCQHEGWDVFYGVIQCADCGASIADALSTLRTQRDEVIEECARIIDERAAMYRGKAEKCDITAPDTLTLRECLASNAEACEWDAAAIRALKTREERG